MNIHFDEQNHNMMARWLIKDCQKSKEKVNRDFLVAQNDKLISESHPPELKKDYILFLILVIYRID